MSSIASGSILRGPDRPELLRHEVLADLFEDTARRLPMQTALVSGDRSLTYAELGQAADVMAHHLMQAGVGPGQLVGLWLPRGMALLVAQLAIAKTGAGWLPFDAEVPVERIGVCLQDAGAMGLVASQAVAEALQAAGVVQGMLWTVEALQVQVDGPLLQRRGAQPHHPAYVIYTSGSTGKPKGIQINQGSICHFLRSENAILGVNASDRVYQGFSVAFDMSFEEIWISYLVGATLWIAPKELVADAEALPQVLTAQGITVLHAVPTLLALFTQDVPSLRLINLGGEMCPEALVSRWALPHHALFNTYGPTEATVSASLARLHAGAPVTIGTPLPNYGLLVRSEDGQLLPQGETGELCIFGPGVAAGYLGRPELTAEKFIDNPWAASPQEQRLYRTGDLARLDEHGQIQCLGRVDDQVKIRGFRVELGEIEALLCAQPGVGTAAVVLLEQDGVQQLLAYVAGDQPLDGRALREALRQQLPAYMVPGQIHQLPVLPRLLSGKIDRKALKALPVAAHAADGESDQPRSEAEAALFAVLRRLFAGQAIRVQDDFFVDLGGHSLLAARLVSMLREDPRFARFTLSQVYEARTVEALTQRLQAGLDHPQAAVPQAARPPAQWPARTGARLWCGLAQLLVLPLLIGLQILQWLAPFFTYHYLTGSPGDSLLRAVLASLGVYVLSLLTSFAVSILGRRVLLAGLGAGAYPLWGVTYFRWWLSDRLSDVAPAYLLHGSSLYVSYLRALGAQIGHDVQIGSVQLRLPALLSVGDGASLGNAVHLENAQVERGLLRLGPIRVEARAHVGSYAVLEAGAVVGEDAVLEGLSALGRGQQVPVQEVWGGAPARWVSTDDPAQRRQRPVVSRRRRWLERGLYAAGALLVSVLFFLPIFPTFIMVDWLDSQYLSPLLGTQLRPLIALHYFLLSIPASVVMLVLTALMTALIRRLILPPLKPGRYPVHGRVYYRKWLANQIHEASLQLLRGLYATVYAPVWLRLLGARVGKNAEVSTAIGMVPDLLTLGDESFIADAVMLGDEEIRDGWMTLMPTQIGTRSFVGNGAYVPDGTHLPDGVLIGVQSTVPDQARLQPGQTWFGAPPISLPVREQLTGFGEAQTFRPSLARRLARGLIEGLRIVLPLALTIGVGYMIVLDVIDVAERDGLGAGMAALTLAGLLYGVGCFVFVVLLKWLLIGRYRPHAAPMWSLFVWLSEAVTSLYESIAVPNVLNFLRGTPWLPVLLRLLGVKIGAGVYLDSTDITEFDCVSIGDQAELNGFCGPQTHLFEDRIMKIGRVDLGARCTLQARSIVLYGARVGEDVRLGPLTLVMKGESIPAATDWTGSPAMPVQTPLD